MAPTTWAERQTAGGWRRTSRAGFQTPPSPQLQSSAPAGRCHHGACNGISPPIGVAEACLCLMACAAAMAGGAPSRELELLEWAELAFFNEPCSLHAGADRPTDRQTECGAISSAIGPRPRKASGLCCVPPSLRHGALLCYPMRGSTARAGHSRGDANPGRARDRAASRCSCTSHRLHTPARVTGG